MVKVRPSQRKRRLAGELARRVFSKLARRGAWTIRGELGNIRGEHARRLNRLPTFRTNGGETIHFSLLASAASSDVGRQLLNDEQSFAGCSHAISLVCCLRYSSSDVCLLTLDESGSCSLRFVLADASASAQRNPVWVFLLALFLRGREEEAYHGN
jgi:hypothetical protein